MPEMDARKDILIWDRIKSISLSAETLPQLYLASNDINNEQLRVDIKAQLDIFSQEQNLNFIDIRSLRQERQQINKPVDMIIPNEIRISDAVLTDLCKHKDGKIMIGGRKFTFETYHTSPSSEYGRTIEFKDLVTHQTHKVYIHLEKHKTRKNKNTPIRKEGLNSGLTFMSNTLFSIDGTKFTENFKSAILASDFVKATQLIDEFCESYKVFYGIESLKQSLKQTVLLPQK